MGGKKPWTDTWAQTDKRTDGRTDIHTHKAKPIHPRYVGCNKYTINTHSASAIHQPIIGLKVGLPCCLHSDVLQVTPCQSTADNKTYYRLYLLVTHNITEVCSRKKTFITYIKINKKIMQQITNTTNYNAIKNILCTKKAQICNTLGLQDDGINSCSQWGTCRCTGVRFCATLTPVSYTHLTLPTILRV